MRITSLSMVAFFLGCSSGSETATEAPVEVSSGAEVSGDAVQQLPAVRVISTGSGPRYRLRYQYRADMEERMQLDIGMTMAMELGGQRTLVELPLTRWMVKVWGTEVDAAGNLRYEYQYENFELVEGGNAAVRNQLSTLYETMIGTRGWVWVNDRGLTLDDGVHLPENADPALRERLEEFRQTMRQQLIQLPEEEVGQGAQWEVTQPLQVRTFQVLSTVAYRLEHVSETTARFSTTISQEAEPQAMTLPDLPPGATASLESLESTGGGSSDTDFTRLTPQSEAHVETNARALIQADGESVPMNMLIQVHLRVGPG